MTWVEAAWPWASAHIWALEPEHVRPPHRRHAGRPGAQSSIEGVSETVAEAVRAVQQLLGDGEWHAGDEVWRVARSHTVSQTQLDAVFEIARVAESDSSRWFCIPRGWTPTFAPDGT